MSYTFKNLSFQSQDNFPPLRGLNASHLYLEMRLSLFLLAWNNETFYESSSFIGKLNIHHAEGLNLKKFKGDPRGLWSPILGVGVLAGRVISEADGEQKGGKKHTKQGAGALW